MADETKAPDLENQDDGEQQTAPTDPPPIDSQEETQQEGEAPTDPVKESSDENEAKPKEEETNPKEEEVTKGKETDASAENSEGQNEEKTPVDGGETNEKAGDTSQEPVTENAGSGKKEESSDDKIPETADVAGDSKADGEVGNVAQEQATEGGGDGKDEGSSEDRGQGEEVNVGGEVAEESKVEKEEEKHVEGDGPKKEDEKVVKQEEPAAEETTVIHPNDGDEIKQTETKEEENKEAEKMPEDDPPSAQVGEMEEVNTKEGNTETVAMETEATTDAHEIDPRSPSPQESVPATATVKYVLMPSAHVTTMACPLAHPMSQLKVSLSGLVRIPAEKLLIMYNGSTVDDSKTLADLGVEVNGAVQLEVSSSDPVNTPLKPPKPQPEYSMPDIITVTVENDDGTPREVVVEIERSTRHKPFLGGYRHRLTGAEFHHASSQTRSKTRPDNGIPKFCRDTQTVSQRNKTQQATRHTSTQMTKIGCYVSNMPDKLYTPGRYTTADEFHHTRLKAVIVLQSYFRRWQAKQHVIALKEDLQKRKEWERKEEMRKIREKEERIRKEFERRMNPRTKEDFDLLYHALEKWRQEELAVIDATHTGAKRKAALCHLLDQETQLIAAISRHKLQADTENKQRAIQNFLDKAAAPRRWKTSDGKYMEMDTAYTVRARELRDIYSSLQMNFLTQDERLDALLTLKHTVKEHDCKLTQEIVELIDREADLLMRGTKESNLEGLRKRISTLFLQYIKTPTFNAEAARLLKVPQDPSTLRQNIYFCPSCGSYLPSTEFQLSSNSKVVGRCRRCVKLDNDARVREDFSHYRYLLKALRRSEEAVQDGARIAFLLQEADLRYLVEDIWNSQSALSAWSDLYDLVLVRWDKDEEWAPWNCILLTKDEATSHFQVENLEKNYGRVFCHKIRTKHTLGRNYFSRLPGMAEVMRAKSNTKAPPGLIPTKPTAAVRT